MKDYDITGKKNSCEANQDREGEREKKISAGSNGLTGLLSFAETSRVLSRGKGSAYSKGGGSRTLSSEALANGNIIAHDRCSRLLLRVASELTPATWYHPGFLLRATSDGQAACMIIEDYPPPPTKPRRQHLHQDTTQRFLNHLVLPKHRTSKFSRCASHRSVAINSPWRV